MAEITSVPAASVAGMIFSLILSIGLPIGLLIYLRNRTGARISAFLIGGATFFLSAMVLEQLLHAAVLAAAGNALTGNIWLYALYGGLAAGLFEETGRYVAMKFCMKKQLTRQSALMYGAGHGGIEAVLILGLASINNLSAVALVNSGGFESFLSSLSAEESDALIQAFSALLPRRPRPQDIVLSAGCGAARSGGQRCPGGLPLPFPHPGGSPGPSAHRADGGIGRPPVPGSPGRLNRLRSLNRARAVARPFAPALTAPGTRCARTGRAGGPVQNAPSLRGSLRSAGRFSGPARVPFPLRPPSCWKYPAPR